MNEPDSAKSPHPYPLFLNVREAAALVVGGGSVAERRVATLLESGARVTMVAPNVTPGLYDLASTGALEWHARTFERADAQHRVLVFSATGSPDIDRTVAAAARAAGAFVNVADDAAASDFHVPAIERRGRIQVAVGTGGAAPGLASRLRDRFAAALSPDYVQLADLLGRVRDRAKRTISDSPTRMRALAHAAGDSDLLAAIARGDAPSPEEALANALAAESRHELLVASVADPGGARVSVVGAGPGAPDLVTLRGLDRIRCADVVIYDDLVDRRLLAEAPDTAQLIYAGKRGWQEDVDGERPGPQMIVELAREAGGRHVVRLKGGDPSVFGRLDEEIAALEASGIPYEIVPGVTAAMAAAAAAHLPLTARGESASVTLATAIASGGDGEVADILPLVRAGGTVVVYMGLRALGAIAKHLVAAGIDPDLPVAVVWAVSTPAESSVRTTLGRAADDAAAAGAASPAIVVIGRTAR